MEPGIVVEELLINTENPEAGINDYKIFCYNGKPEYIVVDIDRYIGHKRNFYNTDWKNLHVTSDCPKADREIEKPKKLDEMLKIASKLSEGFPYVRVDMYEVGERVFFGEMTFYPWSGYVQFVPDKFDFIFGNQFELTSNVEGGVRYSEIFFVIICHTSYGKEVCGMNTKTRDSGRNIFLRYKILINLCVNLIKIFPVKIRKNLLILVRNIKGIIGIGIRYILFKSLAGRCGDNIVIKENVYLFAPERMYIGNNVSIHPMCYIQPGEAKIVIGDNVSIAHSTTIIAESHSYKETDIPIKYQHMISQDVIIEDNVWIGAKCTILMGKIIHKGSIVGANSVVTHNIDENTIVAGNPAKKIKSRI